MHLEIGDTVAVLDDVLKGRVIGISDMEIAVETTDGMIFKFDASELVKIDENQNEISKYSTINDQFLQEKLHEKKKTKSAFVKTKNEVILEVDLHIHQLTKSTKGMDNFDMLSLQIDTARHKIEFAIKKRIPKIVFIHGVGEGVLKAELHYLFNKYPIKYYDASYQKYGLGATEVYIYQNSN